MGKVLTLMFAAAIAVITSGCGHQISQEEQQVRDAATKYRDAYVDGFSAFGSEDVIKNLARGTIQSVTASSNGWDVVFATKSGGKLGHYLHVYVQSSGKLDKVVRDN